MSNKTDRMISLLEQLVGGALVGDFGNAIFIESGLPSSSLGKPNDVYIDTDNLYLYQKGASVWVFKADLAGGAVGDEFSWYNIPASTQVDIGVNRQMIVEGEFTMDGTLIITGQLAII